MKSRIVWILVVFMAAVIGFRIVKTMNRDNEKNEEDVRIPIVKVAEVMTGEIEDSISCIGSIAGQETVTLMSKIPGKIDSFLVEEGDRVEKDDVLVLIDRDIEGMKYEKASIKSPIDGMVIKRFLDKGSQVEPSVSPLMRVPVIMVANINTVKVLVNVSEKYLGRLKEKLEARVRVDAYSEEVFPGEIKRIAPLVDLATRTAEVEIRVLNKNHRLKPGMFARVDITLDKKEDALVVPVKAVLDENGRNFVFVVNGNVAHRKEVKTGIYQKDSVEIVEGLKEADLVIIEGNYGLKDGTEVEIKKD